MRLKLKLPLRTGRSLPQYCGLRLKLIARPRSKRSIRYGPLEMGGVSWILSNGVPTAHLRENTGMPPTIKGNSRLADLKSNRIERASSVTHCFTSAKIILNCGAPLATKVSKEYFTSSASTASPLLNRACGCRRNVIDSRSGANTMSSANRPYMVATSSAELTASVSNIKFATPAAATPFIEKGLNLSKLVRESGLARYKSPPFGASGLK